MDIVKAILFILATLVMIACLVFVPETSTAVSVAYVAVLSLYLGLDVAEMIVSTSKLKAGEFKALKTHKYILSGACLVTCVITCGVRWSSALNTTMTTLLSAIMVILACAIGGLEGNKIATKTDGDA